MKIMNAIRPPRRAAVEPGGRKKTEPYTLVEMVRSRGTRRRTVDLAADEERAMTKSRRTTA